jgi:hypothetical protein
MFLQVPCIVLTCDKFLLFGPFKENVLREAVPKVSETERGNLLLAALWLWYRGQTLIIVKKKRGRQVGELPWYLCGHIPASVHYCQSILSGINFAKLIQGEKLNKPEYVR